MLRNAHLHFAGFSETRALVQFGAIPQLHCNETLCTDCELRDDQVRNKMPHLDTCSEAQVQSAARLETQKQKCTSAAVHGCLRVLDLSWTCAPNAERSSDPTPQVCRKDLQWAKSSLPGMSDVDFYHDYNFSALWTHAFARIREECHI